MINNRNNRLTPTGTVNSIGARGSEALRRHIPPSTKHEFSRSSEGEADRMYCQFSTGNCIYIYMFVYV